MALTLSQIQAATNDYCSKRLTDIYFTENILLYRLMGNGAMDLNLVKGNDLADGGEKIREILEYGKGNSATYGASTTISTTKSTIINAARFPWAGYYASDVVDLDDQVQNNGDAAMISIVMAKLKNIEKTIRDTMGAEIYDARTTTQFNGLADLFNTTTSTAYGEIAEDDMAAWAANVITTSEAISYKVMQKIWRTAAVGQTKSKKPNLAITTETLKDGYERVLQVQQRFSDQKLVEAGFDNVLFKGAPVVADDNQTAGYLDALNLEHLSIKTHSEYNFTKPVWVETDPTTPDKLVANTRWVGNLVCNNRKAHCRHTGLTEPA